MDNIELRPATPDDLEFLEALFADVHGDEFAPLNLAPEALAQLLAMQVRGRRMSYAAMFPGAFDQIILRAGQPVGRLLTVERPEQIHLIDIAVLSEARGLGIGTLVLKYLCFDADRKAKALTLSVREGSRALTLYGRFGLQVVQSDGIDVRMERRK